MKKRKKQRKNQPNFGHALLIFSWLGSCSVLAFLLLPTLAGRLNLMLMDGRTASPDALFYNSLWISIIPLFLFLCIFPIYCIDGLVRLFPRWKRAFRDNQLSPPKQRKAMLRISGRLLIVAACLLVLDVSNYEITATDGVYVRPYAHFHTTFEPWDDATDVETACFNYPSRKRGRHAMLRYDIHFKDGTTVGLFDAFVLNDVQAVGGDKVARLRQVHTILKAKGVPFRVSTFSYGIYKGQEKVNDTCLHFLQDDYPADYQTLINILGIQKYAP